MGPWAVATDGDQVLEKEARGNAGLAEDSTDLGKEFGGNRSVASRYVDSPRESRRRRELEAMAVKEYAEASADSGASAWTRAGGPR